MESSLDPKAARDSHAPGRPSLLASRFVANWTAARQQPRPTETRRFAGGRRFISPIRVHPCPSVVFTRGILLWKRSTTMATKHRLTLPSRLALAAYSLATNVLLPPAVLFAAPFLRANPKRRATLLPRLGFQPYPKFDPHRPPPVWVHALSVGELLSAVPFLQALKARLGERPLVVSVSTLAARELAEARLKEIADGFLYFPFDTAVAYRRCLARIRPALLVLIETDIWPGYLRHFRRAGVPCWLLNGRLSPQSFRGWRRAWWLFGPALACFERIHGQSAAENERFAALGVARGQLGEPGNLKFDACGPPAAPEAVTALRQKLGYMPDDRVLVAGSTHPGEEEIVRDAFLRLRQEFPGLKLISVPRHPARAAEVSALFRESGLEVRLFSEQESSSAAVAAPMAGAPGGARLRPSQPRPTTTPGPEGGVKAEAIRGPSPPAPIVLVVDRLGYLNRLYGLCEVAVVGGSFAPKGGQNPIEPAAAGKPVLFGPDMSDFPEIAVWLVERRAAFQVANAPEVEQRLRDLLADPDQARAMGERGRALVAEHRGVTQRFAHAVVQRLGGTT